jgi:hypothetical protein
MAKVKYLRYALVAAAMVGVFALTGFTNAGPPPTPTTYAQPAAGAAAPYATPSAAPYHYQPQRPREDLPCNPPGTWEVYPSPTTSDLYCVDFVDANNGWAGGRSVALRYSNGTWAVIPGHSGHVFEDIDMLSTTDGWAVGWNGLKEEPAIWRWNGSDWLEVQNPTGAISCIDMIDANHGWIGGNGYFLRYNGTTWEWGGNAPDTMYDIEMNSETEGRALGYRYIMRRSGSNWLLETSNSDWNLGSIYMLGSAVGWAAGQKLGTEIGLILKYENSVWREYRTYPEVRGIGRFSFVGSDWGWCSGSAGIILFFDGNDWTEVNSPTNNSLGVTYCWDKNFGWLMGRYGTILKYKPNVGVAETSFGKIKAIYR